MDRVNLARKFNQSGGWSLVLFETNSRHRLFTLFVRVVEGLNRRQRCLKDLFLSTDVHHCNLRPMWMLFTSKRRIIWTAFTVGSVSFYRTFILRLQALQFKHVQILLIRLTIILFFGQSFQQEHENWCTKDHFASRKPRPIRKATCRWKKPSNVKAVFNPSVVCVQYASSANETRVTIAVDSVHIVQGYSAVCVQLLSKYKSSFGLVFTMSKRFNQGLENITIVACKF